MRSPSANVREPILKVTGVSKSFPGVQALRDVDLDLRAGEVHAVMGENGAGKSTLMRILIGLFPPDRGEIRSRGKAVQFRNPREALRHGISMIHQELTPFPELTVAENIFIGHEPGSPWFGLIDQRVLRREAARLLEQLAVPLSPTRRMRELTVAQMQTVELAKALAHRAEIIIMDEPTSAISEREVQALFRAIGDLRQHGVAILYISHKIEEVFRIADRITVLRDGQHVTTRPVTDLDRETVIALMVGRSRPPVEARRHATPAGVALAVRGLTRAEHYAGINFDLRRGEILGLAGLMGAGRTEMAMAIYGLVPPDSGEIRVNGSPVRLSHPRTAMAHGIAWVSENRQAYGLVGSLGVKQNLTLAALSRCSVGPFVHPGRENRIADRCIAQLGIRTARRNQMVASLSGGNQQKVVLGKALLNDPAILILDEPTRGIDLGAKAEIYTLVTNLAQQGKAILLISSELPEILDLSDRVLVMREGRITAELDPRRTNAQEVLNYAMPE